MEHRRLDLHAHVIPDAYRGLLRVPGGEPFPLPPASVEALQGDMARYEIDAAAISVGPPGAFLGDQGRANETARAANEALAAIARRDPEHFAGLAVLPLPDVDAALNELGHALDTLELDGVLLLSNTAGVYLGDSRWDELFAELDRRGAWVFVHPTAPPHQLSLDATYPVWLYEYPFDTTRAIAHLIFSGTIQRYPSVRFQFAHLGGTAPFLARRLASLAVREPSRAAHINAGVADYLSRQFYDTGLSQDLAAIAATEAVAPFEHIVFGTDWPYAALPENGGDPAPELAALSSAQRSALDSGNAAALIPRWKG
jgi:predicted TIM-barrel fold metal-dependent hydrolase